MKRWDAPPRTDWRTREAAILQTKSHEIRLDFLRTDLELCFTFVSLAETRGEAQSHEAARRYAAHAEKGYSTILRFLSDPKHSKYFSYRELQELKAGMSQLRHRLDRLKTG
jgi:hypothetical protein